MSATRTYNGQPVGTPSAADLDAAAKEQAAKAATAKQTHKKECGEVGETGEHGDLGKNAA